MKLSAQELRNAEGFILGTIPYTKISFQMLLKHIRELEQENSKKDDFIRCCQQVVKTNRVLRKDDWEAIRSGCDVKDIVDSVFYDHELAVYANTEQKDPKNEAK